MKIDIKKGLQQINDSAEKLGKKITDGAKELTKGLPGASPTPRVSPAASTPQTVAPVVVPVLAQMFTAGPLMNLYSAGASVNVGAFASVEDMLLITLGENADLARGSLDDVRKRIEGNNEKQKALRALRAAARGGNDDAKSAVQSIINANPWMRESQILSGFASGAIDFEDFDRALDDETQAKNDVSSALGYVLQVTASQATQADNLKSTLLKKFNDVSAQIIGNI